MRLKAGLKDIWSLFKQAVGAWSDDYAPSMGAALSYYTLFSIAPLLLIVIAVAGWFFGDEAARGELTSGLHGLMGEEGAKAVESMVANASKPKQGIIASVVGVFVLILGATTVFGELQSSLDRIWRAPAREKVSGLWRILRARLLSIGMILGIAFLLMVSLVLDADMLHYMIKLMGASSIALGSDYPFPLGEPVPGGLIESMGLAPAVAARLLHGIAIEWLGRAGERFR